MALVVVWWGHEPNWVMGNRLAIRISWFIHFVTIFSSSLLVHSKRLMGLYALARL